MEFFNTTGLADDNTASQMNVDDEMTSFCKKRPREEDNNGGVPALPHSVSNDAEDDADDDFLTKILGGDETASAAQPSSFMSGVPPRFDSRMPSFDGQMQFSSQSFQMNAPTFDMNAMAKPPPAAFLGSTATGSIQQQHPAMFLGGGNAHSFGSKPFAIKANSITQPPNGTNNALLPSQFASMQQPMFQPSQNSSSFVERWTCDICKSCSFDSFEEAEAHEAQCKQFHNAKKKSEDDHLKIKAQQNEAADVLSSMAFVAAPVAAPPVLLPNNYIVAASAAVPPSNVPAKLPSKKRHPDINLVPATAEESAILSEYNNLLVRNIEFFFPSSDNRIGLRCIHCKDQPKHVTAATFFPSAIGSISSGLGTIGCRHFGWGKCPSVQPGVVQRMIETKKTSNLQTRSKGRVGLDAYCRNVAKQYGIFDDENSGVCFIEGTVPNFNITDDLFVRKLSTSSRDSSRSSSTILSSATDSNSIASVLASMKNDINIEPRPFVPSDTQHFWECNGCRSIPFDFRARGSVVYNVGEPEKSKIEGHLSICTGKKPLAIPRSATIEPQFTAGVPSIKIKWDSSKQQATSTTRSSGRTRRSLDASSIKSGVEDTPLCFPGDQQYTTDFAYFTVTQLKKCYLTKSGGSRGTCPLGFPGLACGHCAGLSTERRFFYTSADHLRNSFSHIPAHLAECSACPAEVKVRIEELKAVRNRQKSMLKPGAHKVFIDRIWERMHGPTLSDDSDADDELVPQYTNTIVNKRRATIPSNLKAVTTTALIEEVDMTETSGKQSDRVCVHQFYFVLHCCVI